MAERHGAAARLTARRGAARRSRGVRRRGQVREPALLDERHGGRQVRAGLAVMLEARDRRRARGRAPPRRPDPDGRRGGRSSAQVEALGGADELDGQDALAVLEDAAQRAAPRSIPSRRGPPGWPRWGWSRPTPDAPAPSISEASAAAVYCRIMSPESRPDDAAQEGRQPVVEARVEEQRHPPLADGAELRDGQLGEVERQRDRLAVEVAAADDEAVPGRQGVLRHVAASGEDERIVGRGVHLDVEDAVEVVEGVAGGAVDLGHAADRVGVLDAVAVARGASAAARCRAAASAARRRCAPGPGADGWTGRRR